LAGVDAAAITGASSLNATDTTAMSIADATTLTSLSNWVGHDADGNATTAGLYYLSDGFAAVQGADATLVNNATSVVATGTANADTMNMSMHSAGMTINGLAGDDVITGTSGADTIDGGADNDTIAGGAGNDQFTISGGNDIITDLTTGDIVDVAVTATVSATGVTAFVATINTQNLGSEAADFAIVAAATGSTVNMDLATVTTANADGFTLTGGDGVDNFTGSDGDDTITGGKGADSLTGGAGADTITGGTGADSLTGGAGADTFHFADGDSGAWNIVSAKVASTVNFDIILDAAAADVINLTAALETEGDYDTFTTASAAADLTATTTTNTIAQFIGTYDADADTFTSDNSGDDLLLAFHGEDTGDTTVDEGIIIVGQTNVLENAELSDGIITIA
jgi:Ca2+-binding RTX toxin-like protein